MQTVAFKTLGCKVNQYETEFIREQFLNAGFKEIFEDSPADIYIINTCTVTQKADSESRRLIRKARRENPKSHIVVTGCYTELDSAEIEKVADNLFIVKNSEKFQILQYLFQNQNTHRRCVNYTPPVCDTVISGFGGRTKAYVKVQDGCDNFCSYCKVPLVRGRSRSRNSCEIISEIKQLILNGYKEIVLTGICLGDWGRNIGLNLTDLLDNIEKNIDGNFRVRLSSIEPWYITEELIKNVANSRRFCRHFHIPMQSGDDEILNRMNRNFTSQAFVDLIYKIRSFIPEVAFTTDVLVGFPGEREAHFNNTLKILELTRPSRVHIFPFSRRKGTKAYQFEDLVSSYIVKDRVNRLRSITDRLVREYRSQFIGRPVQVLVETKRDKRTGLLVGYTDTYIKVVFKGPDTLKGTLSIISLPPP